VRLLVARGLTQSAAHPARAGAGYAAAQFTADWDAGQAVCPQGKKSVSWSPAPQRGAESIVVKFAASDCRPCPMREQCNARWNPRHLSERRLARMPGVVAGGVPVGPFCGWSADEVPGPLGGRGLLGGGLLGGGLLGGLVGDRKRGHGDHGVGAGSQGRLDGLADVVVAAPHGPSPAAFPCSFL
jgi:Transposase DDE domain